MMKKLLIIVLLVYLVMALSSATIYSQFDFSKLVEQIKPGVVRILATWQERGETQQGGGSGFILSSGNVVTNHHVVEGVLAHGGVIEVQTIDGRKYPAAVEKFDAFFDLALLQPNFGRMPGVVYLGDSDQIGELEEFILIGYARGETYPVVRKGTFAAYIVDPEGREWIQYDIAANPGDSGAPVFNLSGQVIGVHTKTRAAIEPVRIYVTPGGEEVPVVVIRPIEGFEFAIPSKVVKQFLVEEVTVPPSRPAPPVPPARGQLLFADNFNDGRADGWTLAPGWRIEHDNGNYVISGEGLYQWVRLNSGHDWTNYILKCRLKLINGGIHLNYRMRDEPREFTRYFIGFRKDGVYLSKEDPPGNYRNLTGKQLRFSPNVWHDVEVAGYEGHLRVYVDGKLELDYYDSDPLLQGRIAFETIEEPVGTRGEGSHAHIDDVMVFALTQPF